MRGVYLLQKSIITVDYSIPKIIETCSPSQEYFDFRADAVFNYTGKVVMVTHMVT